MFVCILYATVCVCFEIVSSLLSLLFVELSFILLNYMDLKYILACVIALLRPKNDVLRQCSDESSPHLPAINILS